MGLPSVPINMDIVQRFKNFHEKLHKTEGALHYETGHLIFFNVLNLSKISVQYLTLF